MSLKVAVIGTAFVVSICVTPAFAGHLEDGEFAFFQGHFDTALSLLRPLAQNGNAAAQFYVGKMYFEGKGLVRDDDAGANWIRQAAKQGFPKAEAYLGAMYSQREGVDHNKAEAVKWYQKAAEHGDENAQSYLCGTYFVGIEIPKDYVQAKKWCEKAADNGDQDAQFNLGSMYYDGNGVPQDFNEAVTWFRKAADHDQYTEFAEFYLGLAYANGQGVLQDYVTAYDWFTKSIAGGNQYAEEPRVEIAKKMSTNQFVEAQDKAAKRGDGKAQLYLGEAYAKGLAVPKDFVLAYMWLNLAASAGVEIAANERDNIANTMNSEQIAEAQRLTREWKPGK